MPFPQTQVAAGIDADPVAHAQGLKRGDSGGGQGNRRRGVFHQAGDIFDHGRRRIGDHQAVHPGFQDPQGGAGLVLIADFHEDVVTLGHQVFQGNDGPVGGVHHHRAQEGQADDFGFVSGAGDRDFLDVLARHQVAVRRHHGDEPQGLNFLDPALGDPHRVRPALQGSGHELLVPGVNSDP